MENGMLKPLLRDSLFRFLNKRGYEVVDPACFPVETTNSEMAIIKRVQPYTMTTVDRIWALMNAVSYVARKPVAGAIVECGVWRGGSMMAAALQLINVGITRDLYLYDTFAGMTEPTGDDKSGDELALSKWAAMQRESHNDWAFSPLEEVRRNMASTAYPQQHVRFIKGPVEE